MPDPTSTVKPNGQQQQGVPEQNSFAPPAAESKTNDSNQIGLGVRLDPERAVLSLAQAAAALGKSMRSIERSLTGRWGNKLPDGWSARKRKTESGEEWVILAPPGFKMRPATTMENMTRVAKIDVQPPAANEKRMLVPAKRLPWRAENHRVDAAVVIDRSEEIEFLLKELVSAQKALAEERRLHMEDMRTMNQMQQSMRLLETSASEQLRIKTELESTKKELEELKQDYNQLVKLPWWKRLFASFTQ